MQVPFIKMHGLGNDFVVLDGRSAALPTIDAGLAAALANRHTGIGCDQLVVLEPSTVADLRVRFFNADGTESPACGNATRAVGLLLGTAATLETLAGVLHAAPAGDGIAVDMGEPRFAWEQIPLAYALDTLTLPVGWEDLTQPVAVNVGNPHVIFFVPDCQAVPLDRLGPLIEHDPLFPERVNVNVATVEGRSAIRLRVWERGTGLTLACGTGACATAVGAMRRGLVDRTVRVTLPGGTLTIAWGEDNRITMTGPATESFRGTFELGRFAA
ncbi:diaminopimelate epimerase [Novosphingobium piscinae]|uniref:Diaminopimelate epimerase n=1 Tax=Novosphingobium piscinae TaxID=1507448 RepID=A0A7X1KPL9_9SPHN|nr:diaminopimelate epimerase [Novosphingobium piscinae]MBC2668565.1 diaminopimelate epimerase [Novosphingobium piscinae]